MLKDVRWGIIGCGNVTEVKSGPAFQKADRSRLVAVMRRDGAKAADYARRHGVPKWHDDADALIRDPDVDAVYVATPPGSHGEYTLRAARAGKPVYVEKPMARTAAECHQMIGACRAAGVPLFVAYYRRALPRFRTVKDLVDGGALGDIRFAAVTLHCPPEPDDADPARRPWRVIPELAGGGRFFDLGSHALDLLDFLLGPVVEVYGLAANQAGLYDAEDVVTATLRFAGGAVGVGVWCFSVYPGVWFDRAEIVGSRGKAVFSIFGAEPIQVLTPSGAQEIAAPMPEHVQQPLIQTVVDALTVAGNCPSTGETAARTGWVMDECVKAWRAARRAAGATPWR